MYEKTLSAIAVYGLEQTEMFVHKIMSGICFKRIWGVG